MDNETKKIAQLYLSMQEKVEYPHMMYDPKTGKGVEAKTPEDHEKLAKMGYTHDKPKEAMDPVNKVAVKKKFDDRKDKDIDNDGDVDSSDEFLHKKRKAISKSMKGESVEENTMLKSYVDIMNENKAKASHDASPKAAEVEPEENPDLPTQKNMADKTKKALDMHRSKVDKKDYPADSNKQGGEKMKQAAKPKTLKDVRR